MALVAVVLSTPAVHAQARLGNFDDADANHDGQVSFQEYAAFATDRLLQAPGPMGSRFKQLSPEERTARLHQRFEQMDKGHKGYLDKADWSAS